MGNGSRELMWAMVAGSGWAAADQLDCITNTQLHSIVQSFRI